MGEKGQSAPFGNYHCLHIHRQLSEDEFPQGNIQRDNKGWVKKNREHLELILELEDDADMVRVGQGAWHLLIYCLQGCQESLLWKCHDWGNKRPQSQIWRYETPCKRSNKIRGQE